MGNGPYIAEMVAISALGSCWSDTWQNLLLGETKLTRSKDIPEFDQVDLPLAAVPGLKRSIAEDGSGPASSLLHSLLDQMTSSRSSLVRLYGGSNHGEAELVRRLLHDVTAREADALLRDELPPLINGWPRWTYAACSSGLHALVAAVLDKFDGYKSDTIVVGVDALSFLEIIGFARIGAVSRTSCRPFSKTHDGLLIGEGAAGLCLTDMMPFVGAAQILGFGLSCDAFHPTDPEPSGHNLERAIRNALSRAGLRTQDDAAVVAHGTGTLKNDHFEIEALSRIWPDSTPVVTSVKGTLGHTMGASGIFNVLTATQATISGLLPGIQSAIPDLHPGIDFALNSPRTIPHGAPVLALASGFGGNNAAFLLGVKSIK